MRPNEDGRTIILVVGYIVIQFVSNITVAKHIELLPGYSIPIGSLLFAISFTWIDLVNDYLGKHRARVLVIVAIFGNVAAILWLEFYLWLPGTPEWRSNPHWQESVEFVLGGYPRVYIAGIVTNFVCENIDISIFHYLKTRHHGIPRWSRSMICNSVSAPLDGILFATLAFYGKISTELLISIAITSALFKLFVSYFSAPLIYVIKSTEVDDD